MSTVDLDDAEVVGRRKSPQEVGKESLITGVAILLPLAVTLLVLSFVLGFLSSNLRPLSSQIVQYTPVGQVLVEAVTVLVLLALALAIGYVAEFTGSGGTLGSQFDRFMQSIPGLGSVYTSFNEMSELLLDPDTDSFQDVKLVEYPGEGSYTVAFKTADTPEMRGLSGEQMAELGRIRRVEDGSHPESTGGVLTERRRERYDQAVDPEYPGATGRIEDRADSGADSGAADGTDTDSERRGGE